MKEEGSVVVLFCLMGLNKRGFTTKNLNKFLLAWISGIVEQ